MNAINELRKALRLSDQMEGVYGITVKAYNVRTKKDLIAAVTKNNTAATGYGFKLVLAEDKGEKGFTFKKAYCKEHSSSYLIFVRIEENK